MPAVKLGQSCAVFQEGSRHLVTSKGKFENYSAKSNRRKKSTGQIFFAVLKSKGWLANLDGCTSRTELKSTATAATP
jgi:hypothetical protein